MQKRVLIALPVVAIVFVVLWRSLASPPVIAQENKRTRIDAPPGVECEALLQSSLEAIQQGLETTEALAPRLAGARVTLSVGTGTDSPDKEWQDTERRSSFVDAFVDAPPGVSISALHRCSDLNPDDVVIPVDLRAAIKIALQPYYKALADARKAQAEAMQQDLDEAERRGLATIAPLSLQEGEPMSLMLPEWSEDVEPSVSQMQALPNGISRTVTVKFKYMPHFDYYESLYWYVAREAGVQIIAIYASLGLVPSNSAELMTRRVVERCDRHIH